MVAFLKFYYSVTTTGVYCRPTCPSRLPHRENVRFHNSCEAAESAGFRPCRRCQPYEPALTERYAAKMAAACRDIEAADVPPTLDTLARATGMSRFHFHRVFTRIVGLTPRAYAAALRAKRTRQSLRKRGTVTEAIYEGGFNSNGRFYVEAPRMLGMTPKSFRTGARSERIRFAAGECSLGSILVAATTKGICAILLGDDPDRLARDLQDRFPKADLIGDDQAFEKMIGQVIGLVEAPQLGLKLPLDIRGTAFQRRVWKALQAIPAGTTESYTTIARRIGAPKSARAVAGACAANAIAVAIPCHRVVRTDGSLSGYRWGVKRKRALLSREAA
jgi:AraC family transcriptional regulator of adaptative response/methylated-DNA-[protein]-cysteine methyltransferase